MKHIDLFSGIGGFALAASRVWPDHHIVTFCEKDPYCQKVLKKHWPDAPICEDIYDLKGIQKVDLLTGGFPCQPFSVAGKQRGERDDRFLWPEMLRVIRESKPTWVVGENVPGIIGMALDQVLIDLEMEGYACQCFVIPACGVDAPHKRNRIWVVAHSEGERTVRRPEEVCEKNGRQWRALLRESQQSSQDVAYASELHSNGGNDKPKCKVPKPRDGSGKNGCEWQAEPDVGRVAHGIPKRVDRLRALGNAIVPQVAEQIFRAIRMNND